MLFHCRLYERLSEEDQAAAAYTEYINETEMQGVCMFSQHSLGLLTCSEIILSVKCYNVAVCV